MPNSELKFFNSGTQTLLDDTVIAADAASASQNWITQDGRIKLAYGRAPLGVEGGPGKCTGEGFGYMANGTQIHWAKFGADICYWSGSAWVTTVTGLTVNADYTFANYSSVAGAFTYAFGPDGIYKMANACPGFYLSMYNSAINFLGLGLIDKGRTILWGRKQDMTGLYGSRIDPQNSTVYTSVANELLATGDGATTAFTGTLAAAGAPRNVFGLQLIVTGAAKDITAITRQLNPQFTVASHGYTVGQKLYLTGFPDIITGSGTVAWAGGIGYITVTGTSTAFTTACKVGSLVSIGQYVGTVISIASDTSMVVDYEGASGGAAIAYTAAAFSIYTMTQFQNMVVEVQSVVDTNNFTVNWVGAAGSIDSTNYTPYSAGGTAAVQTQQAVDDFNGNITPVAPSTGITGTINYITGAYSITFTTPPASGGLLLLNYQWENSNAGGITDFTHSATRIAAEGFYFPQDEGGTPTLRVIVGLDGTYYSFKTNCVYQLALAADDITADNEVYRRDIGIQSLRGVTATQFGIVFINTANPIRPEVNILQRNPVGGDIEPSILFPNFKFADYDWHDAALDTYERYIVMACKSASGVSNDTILLGNPAKGTMSIDITSYAARTFAKDNLGNLFMGSSISLSIYNVYNGFDDNGYVVQNFWTGRGEIFQPIRRVSARFIPASLKKHRKLRFKGLIDRVQSYEVYCDYDDAGPQLVGTVLGSASYVDMAGGVAVGQSLVGEGGPIGGGMPTTVYPYFCELRIKKPPKFLKRKITFKALGFGYVDISYQNDWGLMFFEDKLPTRFRQKQNVSLDGTQTNLPTPEF